MAARRILIMIAVLMGISALSVAVSPPQRERTAERPDVSTGGVPAPAESDTVERTISAEAVEAPTVTIPVGTTLRLIVTSKTLDGVEVKGLDRFAPLAPETPAEIEILADRAGTFDLRLVQSGRLIGRLKVT